MDSHFSLCFHLGNPPLARLLDRRALARRSHIWPKLTIVTSHRDPDKLPIKSGPAILAILTLHLGSTLQLSSSARWFPFQPYFTTVSITIRRTHDIGNYLQSAGPLTLETTYNPPDPRLARLYNCRDQLSLQFCLWPFIAF